MNYDIKAIESLANKILELIQTTLPKPKDKSEACQQVATVIEACSAVIDHSSNLLKKAYGIQYVGAEDQYDH